MTPKLVSVSPNSGSIGGSLITATVPGIGSSASDITLVDADGNDICEKVSIPSYGVLNCKTKAEVIAAATQLSIQYGEIYECVNTDPTQCQYE